MISTAIEINNTPEIRKKTADKLGISEEQLEMIRDAIKQQMPSYHYGYDYNSILTYMNKVQGR